MAATESDRVLLVGANQAPEESNKQLNQKFETIFLSIQCLFSYSQNMTTTKPDDALLDGASQVSKESNKQRNQKFTTIS